MSFDWCQNCLLATYSFECEQCSFDFIRIHTYNFTMKLIALLPFLFLWITIATSISDSAAGTSATARLTNGLPAAPGFFPYVAEVKLSNNFQCAGVIISENWVLITSYCIPKNPVHEITVRVGGVNRTDPLESGAYEVRVDRYVRHGEWIIVNRYLNNVCLLHVEQPLVFSTTVKAATLALQSKPIDMSLSATVAGWGGGDIAASAVLHYSTNFQLIEESYCTPETSLEVTPNSLCTNGTAPNPATCYRDDGSPLLQFDDTKGMVLHGIVSYYYCQPGMNTFYENILNHRVWIHLVTGV